MISKLSNLSKSFFAKFILTITALSFVSLFGVSGYINTANSNKTVLRVDNIELSQSEFNYNLQRELAKLRAVLGNNFDADNDTLKNELAAGLIKLKLSDAIIENTMHKYGIDFSENLIRNVIILNPQFNVDGKFSKEAYSRYLQAYNMSEREFVDSIKRNLAKKVILDSQVLGFNIPQTRMEQMKKITGQRRTFKYLQLNKDDAKIDRYPSKEEIDQYYSDFSEEFNVAEKRDVTMLYISLDDIAANSPISQEETDAYYKEHIDEFEKPEEREILQIVFDSKDDAVNAKKLLDQGEDFASVAQKYNQSDINLGFVSEDQLLPELAKAAFSLNVNGYSDIIDINDEWQILKVATVNPAQITPRAEAEKQIISELKQEKAYNGSYEIISDIEDRLAAEEPLEKIAEEYNVNLIEVNGIGEDGTSESKNINIAQLLGNGDIIDAVFSYNEGETSQAVEDDTGIVIVKVNKINESHIAPLEDVKEKIIQIWTENEKNSITQELVDNIEHDLNAGDPINEVATRYGVAMKKTMPVSRFDTFANLTSQDMAELFALPKDEHHVIDSEQGYIVALTSEIYDDSASLKDEDIAALKNNLTVNYLETMSDALLKDFAKDYKVEVNYNRAGLVD